MKCTSFCLSKSEISLLISNDLPPAETAASEQHIAECEKCRSAIEAMIADAGWWDDARQSLAGCAARSADQAELAGDTEPTTTEQMLELLAPTDDPTMLGRIGGYEIVGILGQGGMGAVFKGLDRSLNRFVAIKMLLPHLAASGAARKRFAREAQAVAAVVDDHVMAIHCVDQWQGVPYLVMTYSRGVSLQKRLGDNGPLESREILRIGMQAAKGLAAAHAQGIVHRDIKPANIFLDQNVERVQLMDFGLARAVDDASLTRSGTLAGTPQYMSPEQARAETVDHRSDLFSLGSVLYAMCTGHAPFRAESSYSVLRLITDKEPRAVRQLNPDIPEWLCAIISKLMAKQASDRFASAQEVAELLEGCLAHVQQPTTMPLPAEVYALAAHSQPRNNGFPESNERNRPKATLRQRPPIGKFIALVAFAFALLLAGVLIVLETNTGTLTIESEADAVPIRITQGEDIVKTLTVSREGTTTRLHAGHYTLEVDAPNTQYEVADNEVVVKRGGVNVAKITYRAAEKVTTLPLTEQRRLTDAIREFNNLHPTDAQGRRQPPLTQGELLAVLLWKMGNGELSDEVVLAMQPIIYTRERVMPGGWRFIGGLVYEPYPQGVVQSWQIKLETNGSSKPISIRRSAVAPSPSVRKPGEAPIDVEEDVSLASLIESFNAAHPEIEQRSSLPHELPPLTLDEALASIELSLAANDSDADGPTSQRLQRIVATQQLPANARIELIPAVENAIGQRFTVEFIRLVIPRADDSDSADEITVRHQFIELDYKHPEATRWSEPGRNGLQAGVRLVPALPTYEHGQVVEIEFLYRSATSQIVPATLPRAFQFGKVSGIRLERVSFVQPKWPDGSVHTSLGNEPQVVRGHRLQFCFDSNEALKPGVNLRAITRPKASHYVRFTVPNPGNDAAGETLEIAHRLHFNIPPRTPPKILPLYEAHYYQHWGISVPGHRRPEQSTPAPEYIDPFQIGVSLGPAEKSRIPAYYASGLQVTKVAPYSPAASAGIEVGDILLSWEGNQIHGDDPHKPFADYSNPNHQLREATEKQAKYDGHVSFNMRFDLLDSRTGEVISIAPWFGFTAGGGPNKSEVIKRITERKLLRQGQD